MAEQHPRHPKDVRQAEQSQQALWLHLCHQAWVEEDPVRLLDITMQIVKFLASKQERLDAAFDEAQQIDQAQQAQRKNGVN
jgi:hypothetical protein